MTSVYFVALAFHLILGGLSRTQTTQHLLMKEIGFPITLKPTILLDVEVMLPLVLFHSHQYRNRVSWHQPTGLVHPHDDAMIIMIATGGV